MNYKVITRRTPTFSRKSDSPRKVSPDGTHWAMPRMAKRSLPDHRFDIVEVWDLKTRNEETGKAYTVRSCVSEGAAIEWTKPTGGIKVNSGV